MADTVIAGKPSNVIGSPGANLVLKGLSIKIQWGNKFIDLIKNGKIAAESEKFLFHVESEDLITKDGIYLTQDQQIWVCINGTKLNITNLSDLLYVSFLNELLEVTSELKLTALKNIGFYFDSLNDAVLAGLKSGIIYAEKELKLYIIKNQKLVEYSTTSAEDSEILNKFASLLVGSLNILQNTISTSDGLLLLDENDVVAEFNTSHILFNLNLIILKSILSYNYTEKSGFAISQNKDSYTLYIDDIVCRNLLLGNYLNTSKLSNIIVACNEYSPEIPELGYLYLLCTLKYKNNFNKYEDASLNNILVQVDKKYVLSTSIILETSELPIGILQESDKYKYIYIKTDPTYISKFNLIVEYLENENILSIEAEVENGLYSIPSTWNVINIYTKNPIIVNDESIPHTFIKGYLLEIQGNLIVIKIKTNNGNILPNSLILQTASDILPELGHYCDNLIGINSILYSPTFNKSNGEYPKYLNLELPQDFNDSKYDLVVPNIAWVKKLIQNIE